MATTVQLSGGGYQDAQGNALSNGYLLMELSQDAVTTDEQQVEAGYVVKILLDANGNVQSSPAQFIWPNDVLLPANTFYNVTVYTENGQRVWGPNAQQVFSSPSPYDIGVWVPGSINVTSTPFSISVGTTTTLAPGSNATVVNAGTSINPILDFGIPRGDVGATGATGPQGNPGTSPSPNTASLPLVITSGNISINDATTSTVGVVKADGTTIAVSGSGVISTIKSPPSGAAGGDLAGTYPNPSVTKVNGGALPASSTFIGTNSASQIVTATLPVATNTNEGIVQPDGTTITVTGGVISAATQSNAFSTISSGTNTSAAMTVGTGSTLTTTGSGVVNANEVNGAALPTSSTFVGTNSSGQVVTATLPIATTSVDGIVKPDGTTITVTGGVITATASSTGISALTGDVTATGPGSVPATLATVNSTPGTFGSTTAVPVITTNGKGLVTHTTTATLGTMAVENSNAISVTGGTIDGTTIGGTTPAVGTFTTLGSSLLNVSSTSTTGITIASLFAPSLATGMHVTAGIGLQNLSGNAAYFCWYKTGTNTGYGTFETFAGSSPISLGGSTVVAPNSMIVNNGATVASGTLGPVPAGGIALAVNPTSTFTVDTSGNVVTPSATLTGVISATSLATNSSGKIIAGTGAPSGAAGGDLSGTYPNPTVSAVHATSGSLNGVTIGATTPAGAIFTGLSSSINVGVGATPTVVAGNGAGTSPTALSILGRQNCGTISLNTGTSPVTNGTIVTVTLPIAYPAAVVATITLGPGVTVPASVFATGLNSFAIAAIGTLPASTAWSVSYQVSGY